MYATWRSVDFLRIVFLTLLLAASRGDAARAQPAWEEGPSYQGMCDASAAVAVGQDMFVVANDEDNVLRVFRRDRGGQAVASFDLSPFLRPDPKNPETDIEGATWLAGRIFWITSHGCNDNGKRRPSRQRLFATEVKRSGDKIAIQGVGQPYSRLLDDLIEHPELARYGFAPASRRAPKNRGALNIEALAATPDGALYIGFRNPIPDGKAILVPLANPLQVIKGERAQLGQPIELDLNGLGVRSIEFAKALDQYVILAGPHAQGSCRMCLWSGQLREKPRLVEQIDFGELTPEAMALYSDKPRSSIQFFSDDGTRQVGGTQCKQVKDPNQRTFRSLWLRGLARQR